MKPVLQLTAALQKQEEKPAKPDPPSLANLRNGSLRGPGGHKESTMHEYGDCSFCGGEVKEELIELDYRYKKQLYIFRDVPTGVCQQCGEKYLVASTAKVIAHAIRTKKDWPETVTPRSRSQVEPYDFCTYVQKVTQKEVLFLDLELDGRQECSYEDRNVAALMLTMPCSVSGDNPFLTFFPTIPLQFVSPLNVG